MTDIRIGNVVIRVHGGSSQQRTRVTTALNRLNQINSFNQGVAYAGANGIRTVNIYLDRSDPTRLRRARLVDGCRRPHTARTRSAARRPR
jgi:hypothetical protein